MNLYPVSIAVKFLYMYTTFTAATSVPTHSATDVLIDCGSNGTYTGGAGRQWLGDVQEKFTAVELKGSSWTSRVLHGKPFPYKTARLSLSWFSYAFHVNPGQKILRLHFNSYPYTGFKRYRDLFSVQAGVFTLLSNFSASLTADALGVDTLVKEFCVNIQDNQLLDIIFSSSKSPLQDTYAFVNGIELISVPPSHSYLHMRDFGLQLVGKSLVYIDNSTAFEIVQRLNVERDSFSSSTDNSGDGFGLWETPSEKEDKVNVATWKVLVDVGFRYLVRLHFSSAGFNKARSGGVISRVLINEMVADISDNMDTARDDHNLPLYRDYMVVVKGNKHEGKRYLSICQESDDEIGDGRGLLKGFEILKMSNPDNSLASPNPLPSLNDSSYQTLQSLLKVGQRNMVANAVIVLLILVDVIVYTLRKVRDFSHTEEAHTPSTKAAQLCRQFSLDEIHLATSHFSSVHLIGRGGFGEVYKGLIDNGKQAVAIKRLKSNSNQGPNEFLTEIETLTQLRHVNLVSLIGYCNDSAEMILVYEYMASGSLSDHLFKRERNRNISPLTWKERLNVCIGAGRGLDYLHTGHPIIHRDIKTSNILLDEYFTAKVSDFGLAKPLRNMRLQESHVSTKVKGTFGYFDPEYFSTGKLSRESDIYAFGVVLLEVLSGKQALDPCFAEEDMNLTMWATEHINMGTVEQIVASSLRDEISHDSLMVFVDVAAKCLNNESKKRPTMAEVVLQLVFALRQQESFESSISNEHHNLDDSQPSISEDTEASEDVQSLGLSVRKHPRNKGVHIPAYLWPWGAVGKKGLRFKEIVQKGKQFTTSFAVLSVEGSNDNSQSPELKFIAAPAIPSTDLKVVVDHFGKKHFNNEGICYAELRSGQTAAFKKVKRRGWSDREFLAQVSMILNLKHENVAELLGYYTHGGLQILAYEHASDGSLHDFHVFEHVHGPSLTWTQKVKIAVGAAKGLEYLHEKGHVHFNIRSSNILLFGGVEVSKITNIGLDNKKHEDRTKEQLGYRAPEYINGEPTSKTDVYNFGVVLLELLTGSKPRDTRKMSVAQLKTVAWDLSEAEVICRADARLNGKYPPSAVAKMVRVAFLCMQSSVDSRPNMSTVVRALQPLLDAASSSSPQN